MKKKWVIVIRIVSFLRNSFRYERGHNVVCEKATMALFRFLKKKNLVSSFCLQKSSYMYSLDALPVSP